MSQLQLVEPAWLHAHRNDEDLILIDTRDAAAYAHGHLPGARHLDVNRLVLGTTDRSSVGEYVTWLAGIFAALGVSWHSRVLFYGERTDPGVARAAWALWFAGHDAVAVLDGGLAALSEPALTTDVPQPGSAAFSARPRWQVFAGASEVAAALHAPQSQLLDARNLDEYLGHKSAALRSGRIPGARHWDVQQEQDGDAGLAAPERLALRFAAAGFDPDKEIIAYCGSGGRAARTFLALTQAGYRRVRVYPASWKEWGNREDLPIEGVPAAAA